MRAAGGSALAAPVGAPPAGFQNAWRAQERECGAPADSEWFDPVLRCSIWAGAAHFAAEPPLRVRLLFPSTLPQSTNLATEHRGQDLYTKILYCWSAFSSQWHAWDLNSQCEAATSARQRQAALGRVQERGCSDQRPAGSAPPPLATASKRRRSRAIQASPARRGAVPPAHDLCPRPLGRILL